MPYTAVVLTKRSRFELLNFLGKSEETQIPEDWEIIAHHMTMKFGANSHKHERQSELLTIDAIGQTDKVIAVRVNAGGHLSTNDTPHITIAVDRANGGKPVQSNNILNWTKLENPPTLMGTIEICK